MDNKARSQIQNHRRWDETHERDRRTYRRREDILDELMIWSPLMNILNYRRKWIFLADTTDGEKLPNLMMNLKLKWAKKRTNFLTV